jgi:uncharacterized membrane protein
MNTRATILTCALVAVLFLSSPAFTAKADTLVQYRVLLSQDGSATWNITQAADLNVTMDTWQSFQQRIANLVSDAQSLTQRTMSLDNDSLQMNTIWENQSQTTEYQFSWLNFSIIQTGKIIFGDAFQTQDFFGKLYGDGEIKVIYPTGYTVQSVSPQPNGGETDPQTLDWLGTQFFVIGDPSVVLVEAAPSPTPSPTATPTATPNKEAGGGGWQFYALLASGIVVAVAASLAAFFIVKRRKTTGDGNDKAGPELPLIESEEEKVVKAIQASGGSAYQSAITEKCRFSKAKTSQLLSALEKKGVLTRYKRGRDKIVNLTEKGKGGSS